MGSLDQDITILVTNYDNNEEKEEETSIYLIEPDMVKIDEHEELRESNGDVKRENRNENIFTETAAPEHTPDTSDKAVCDEAKTDMKCEKSEVKDNQGAHEQLRDVSMTKPSYPESPAPFGCHNIRTQVSLEVVQCQSAATSPMTPPEGDQAFYFPSSFGTCAAVGTETKDAELQVGQQVEFRSVATAPMTPRTPTTTTFPEFRKEASTEEKIVEEEEDKKEQEVENKEEVVKEEEEVTKEKKVEAAKEDTKEDGRNCKDKCEEPVQEVSWDEKGMTWEVYGAVVEVTVLGSAIQKHLEKQVKKRQPSMPPPPPLNPSAIPLSSESTRGGSGKSRVGKRGEQDGEVTRRRRNPFRLMMENIQQPHCCSKAHTTE
ncbi:G protein-regulated inducer of neurite outgrowth 1 [Collichthys lucidus]|uniref:G protein-regulated inducer of neurite outgrowth 1 n=1 Tax=Collichthys lucidus TaxID=240159 RepID=A0A4U5UDD2_COLLU|nr:G protein-regulated inducer of neurite outgrowth 1 [Collichthys lucidus]